MRLEKLDRAVISSGTMEVAQATIKSSRKVFDMFSDQTYANKPVAIARELVANGIDAHVAAGTPNVPVEVIMPTELEPEFKVRDHGIGMSHEFVMTDFMQYTNGSTKDQSDDQIGGFGIGSKSPFAYCDQFTLRVVKDGILSVYTMFKDDEGIPSIGLQGQTTTDENNGVEVSFPVETQDMEDFRSAAQTALQYFHPLPTVHNGEVTPPDYSHVSSTGKWAMRPQSGALGVIMGGVRYPVNSDSLPWAVRRNKKVAPMFDYGIDVTLPIGTLDIAMSREALSYTQKTFDGLTNALGNIVDEVAVTFATLFDHHKTLWDAQIGLYNELSNLSAGSTYSYKTGGRVGMMRSYSKYKGQPLKPDIDLNVSRDWDSASHSYQYKWPTNYPKGAEAWVAIEYAWLRSFPTPNWGALGTDVTSITPGAHEVVFIDDMEIAPKSRIRARVENYLNDNHPKRDGNHVLVLRASKNTNDTSINELLAYLGNPSNVVRLSTLPEPPRAVRSVSNGGTMVTRPKVRMFTYTGGNDKRGFFIDNLAPSPGKRDAVKEIDPIDQPTTGIMVTLYGWGFPSDFKRQMKAGIVKYDELLFVLTGDAKKLKGQPFEKFEDVYAARLAAKKKENPKLGQNIAIAEDDNLSSLFSDIRKFREWLELTPAQRKTPFGKIVRLYDENVAVLTPELRAFASNANIGAKVPDGLNTQALAEAFKVQQPHAAKVLDLIRYEYDESTAALLVNNL